MVYVFEQWLCFLSPKKPPRLDRCNRASRTALAAILFESRAWCTSLSNGYLLQSKLMQGVLSVLQDALVAGEWSSRNQTAIVLCEVVQ